MDVMLPTAPPYEWSKLYSAASNMQALLGTAVPMSAAVVLTETGFDVFEDSSGSHLLVKATVKQGDDWEFWRSIWVQAVYDAPHIKATLESSWLNSVQALDAAPPNRPDLKSGDPVGLGNISGRGDLDGIGGTLVRKADEGGWIVQPLPISTIGNAAASEPPILVPAECALPLPNWPFLGVSVACLHAFADAFGLREPLDEATRGERDATTEDVVNRIVKPLTEEKGESLAALLQGAGAVDSETGSPFVGRPTVFVSHARKYRFIDLLMAVNDFSATIWNEEEEDYFWIDIFSQVRGICSGTFTAIRVICAYAPVTVSALDW